MVANNIASKEGKTSADANNVEEGTRRTFTPEPTRTTRAMNRSFGDAFRKVNDARCTIAASLKREDGQSFHPGACSLTFAGVPWPNHRPPEAQPQAGGS
jgi:hypothetical protein